MALKPDTPKPTQVCVCVCCAVCGVGGCWMNGHSGLGDTFKLSSLSCSEFKDPASSGKPAIHPGGSLPTPAHAHTHSLPPPQDEVRDMAKKCAAAGLQLLVIDTENKFVSTGFAEEIAKAANGKYYYLPNASDAAIAMAASSAMAAAKAGM